MKFNSREELLEYARKLEGTTVRDARESMNKEFKDELPAYKAYSGKGGFGQYIEEQFFGKTNDNISKADFKEIGVELKASPLKKLQDGTIKVKERLVFGMINYNTVVNECFETAHVFDKCKFILLVFYMYDLSKAWGDMVINLVDIWETLAHDYDQIKADWNYIVDKIKAGKAHELSEADTIILGACTKGETKESSMCIQPFSPEKARKRAFCFKTQYIRKIYNILSDDKKKRRVLRLNNSDTWIPLETLIAEKTAQFLGMSGKEIALKLNVTFNPKDKAMYSKISRYMLGLYKKDDVFQEFESGNIQIKTIRVEADGKVKENMSFKNIYYKDIVSEEWEESIFYEELTSKFVFMVFKAKDDAENYYFEKGFLWSISEKELEEAEKVWIDARDKIRKNDFSHFMKSTSNPVAHVRPKGNKDSYYMETALGTLEKKKCFWLNRHFIEKIVSEKLQSPEYNFPYKF